MSTAYRVSLANFADDLVIMGDLVREIMAQASDGLLRGSLAAAESALSLMDGLTEMRARCDERAIDLLLLEGPLARDLRQVISSIYIVNDLDRMGALGMHIARTARRHHPDTAVPAELTGFFQEYVRLTRGMTEKTRSLLADPNADIALELVREDDAVDDLNAHVLRMLTERAWAHTTAEAVDTALLSRFYERYADHCVNVATRIVYLTTGLCPEEYLAQRQQEEEAAEAQTRLEALERQFHRGYPRFGP